MSIRKSREAYSRYLDCLEGELRKATGLNAGKDEWYTFDEVRTSFPILIDFRGNFMNKNEVVDFLRAHTNPEELREFEKFMESYDRSTLLLRKRKE